MLALVFEEITNTEKPKDLKKKKKNRDPGPLDDLVGPDTLGLNSEMEGAE